MELLGKNLSDFKKPLIIVVIVVLVLLFVLLLAVEFNSYRLSPLPQGVSFADE
jgi:hypothetical protein